MNSCGVGSHLLIEMCHLSSPAPAQRLQSELVASGDIVARFPANSCVFHGDGDGSSVFDESASLMQNGHELELAWAWLQPLLQAAGSARPLSLGSGQHRGWCRFCVTTWALSGKQKTAFESRGFAAFSPTQGGQLLFGLLLLYALGK